MSQLYSLREKAAVLEDIAGKKICFLFLYLDSIFFVHVCIPVIFYMSIELLEYLMGPRISCDAYKLTRTLGLLKKKKKGKGCH